MQLRNRELPEGIALLLQPEAQEKLKEILLPAPPREDPTMAPEALLQDEQYPQFVRSFGISGLHFCSGGQEQVDIIYPVNSVARSVPPEHPETAAATPGLERSSPVKRASMRLTRAELSRQLPGQPSSATAGGHAESTSNQNFKERLLRLKSVPWDEVALNSVLHGSEHPRLYVKYSREGSFQAYLGKGITLKGKRNVIMHRMVSCTLSFFVSYFLFGAFLLELFVVVFLFGIFFCRVLFGIAL